MNHGRKAVTFSTEVLIGLQAFRNRRRRSDPVHKQNLRRIVRENGVISSQLSQAQKIRSNPVRINETQDLPLLEQESTQQHARMAAGADKDQRTIEVLIRVQSR